MDRRIACTAQGLVHLAALGSIISASASIPILFRKEATIRWQPLFYIWLDDWVNPMNRRVLLLSLAVYLVRCCNALWMRSDGRLINLLHWLFSLIVAGYINLVHNGSVAVFIDLSF